MTPAEFCRSANSSRVRGRSIIFSTPLRPRMEGSERAIPVRPYWPVRTDDRGMIFLLSLWMDSTIELTTVAIP